MAQPDRQGRRPPSHRRATHFGRTPTQRQGKHRRERWNHVCTRGAPETVFAEPITDARARQIERANATTATPVVFIHGLWLLPSSWDAWAELFEEAGYVALTPDWPDDPETVEVARAEPEVLASKTLKQVADHTTEVITGLDKKPVIMGHSTGGLLAEMLAGQGLSAVTVAIDPGVFRGVLPLPFSVLRSAGPFLINPRNRGRALTLTFDQFRYSWTNNLDEQEAMELYDKFHVAASGISLAQMGNANLNPWTEAKVNTKNPDRGPLLIIEGEEDHTVPWAIAKAAYDRQKRNPGVTEIVKIPNRGHSLTIDHGWRESPNGARVRQEVRVAAGARTGRPASQPERDVVRPSHDPPRRGGDRVGAIVNRNAAADEVRLAKETDALTYNHMVVLQAESKT